MKVLIIDDSEYKIQSLQGVIEQFKQGCQIEVAHSFQSGVRKLKVFRPELLLLDMSLPTSETEAGELEGRMRVFGGREILVEMKFHDIQSKVVIVTQFDHFGEPPNSTDLETLLTQLQSQFGNLLIGGIYYSNIDSLWRQRLLRLLKASIGK